MKKFIVIVLALLSSSSFAAPANSSSKLIPVYKGIYNAGSQYRLANIYGTTFIGAPLVYESAAGVHRMFIMNGESASSLNVLPESSPYWTSFN